MNWNHRIYRDREGTLHFKEVFYTESGAPMGATDIFTCGDDVDEMRTIAARLAKACTLPVLSAADFKAKVVDDLQMESIELKTIVSINPYPTDEDEQQESFKFVGHKKTRLTR